MTVQWFTLRISGSNQLEIYIPFPAESRDFYFNLSIPCFFLRVQKYLSCDKEWNIRLMSSVKYLCIFWRYQIDSYTFSVQSHRRRMLNKNQTISCRFGRPLFQSIDPLLLSKGTKIHLICDKEWFSMLTCIKLMSSME